MEDREVTKEANSEEIKEVKVVRGNGKEGESRERDLKVAEGLRGIGGRRPTRSRKPDIGGCGCLHSKRRKRRI